MSAPPGPRGFKGSRPPTRARGTFTPRGPRAGFEDNDVRKTGPAPNHRGGVRSMQTRVSSRGGTARGPSGGGISRGAPSHRATSRQIRSTPKPAISNRKDDALRDATTQEPTTYRAYMEKTFRTLEEQRKQERKDAIRGGLLADPDKPTTLANAITIIGTCQDMCAEHERVQRITQFMVDDCEKVPHATKEGVKVPSEDCMVKRYRRPAAGYEEQLPSDIRPPLVLQKTLDYLMDEIVGGPEPLATVHKFVWDRTRAIRNDFSIQQVTKVNELRIAISCFERIARFHILSLHQLAQAGENGVDFDAYQEREQLNNTLLSLMYYYDDSRHKLVSPNEPEFRAYCIIFEIQDQRPDLEDRAQNWPLTILKDRRVQTAMKLYAAAANTSDAQGPLRPQVPNAIAQANTPRFFDIVQSPGVPYLMACVAEIYFNKVRRTALDTIWKVYKVKRGGSAQVEDWTLSDLTGALGFDDEPEAQKYCEDHGFTVTEKENGEAYVDLGSVAARYLSDANANRKQAFSTKLVDQKRHGRTLPAIINGMTAAQAQAQGLVVEEYSDSEGSSPVNDEILFLPDGTTTTKPLKDLTKRGTKSDVPEAQEKPDEGASRISPFSQTSTIPFKLTESPKADMSTSATFFGKPSISASSPPNTQIFAPQPNPSRLATSSSFSIQHKPDSEVSPSSHPDRAESKPPSFDFAKPPTSQAQPNPTQTSSPPRSIFDPKPSSTSGSPKFGFGSSPFFNQTGADNASQPEKKSKIVDSSAGPGNFKASGPAENEPKASDSPFAFLNSTPATSITPPFALFPQASAPVVNKETVPKSSQPPFSSFSPASALSSAPSETTKGQPDEPAKNSEFPFAKPKTQSPASLSFSPTSNAIKPPDRAPSHSPPKVTEQTYKTPGSGPSQPKPSIPPTSTPEPAVMEAPDPRPVILDALAEGILMENQGLLQQFIEYTIGPIVHEAFQEVEEERSWKRAREVRTTILSRKYLQRWKETVWKRKLMRKGKERRAMFAKSMQEMARSSRPRHSSGKISSQSNSADNDLNWGVANHPERSMPPPLQPQQNLKRKSFPTDFEVDNIPNAEGSHGNKRKRQDPSLETKASNRSLHTSPKSHHKRSRTMGDSRRPVSLYANLADFSQLDENTYANEKVLRQARRLVGQAKLDTTRGDYFALKARGIDPDTPFTPQAGIKRSRVDEQIERVRKLLKPSPPGPKKSDPLSPKNPDQPHGLPSHAVRSDPHSTRSSTSNVQASPDDLLAQVRQVREALAESTAWFQAEREKSEHLSSSRSSEVTHQAPAVQAPPQSSRTQLQSRRPREWNPTPTRAQIRLEKTRANGLLPPDWDWNKSVTEWKLRGGTGSPRPGASGEQSGRSTPAVVVRPQQQQRKQQIGLAAAANGLGRRREQSMEEADVVYDDDEEEEVDEEHSEEDYDEGEGEAEEYANGYEEEYEDEYEEEGQDDEILPERAALKAQGNSADTAIDLD
ncbi:MAG: hypothetical protein Q9225_002102 [Loekoesia sp. 1 TL-2023]